MKKNILLLINGFGVEQVDSYNIYSKEVMPNLDRLTTEWLFSSLQSKELDYKEGYRKFSIGINEALTYNIIEQEVLSENYANNVLYKSILDEISNSKKTLHIFCFFENEKTINQLLAFLKKADSLGIKVLVHLILCQKSLRSYKEMDKTLVRLNYEFNNIKIGLVTGLNNLSDAAGIRDIEKALIGNFVEKWKDLSKKIGVLSDTKSLPVNARTFSMSENVTISNDDKIIFFNYFQADVRHLINIISSQQSNPNLNPNTIKYYSLFPVVTEVSVPFMYNYAVSSTYLLDSMNKINAKAIVFDKKENTGYINYYLTGLRSKIDNNLQYYFTDDNILYDASRLIPYLASLENELIILNYEIDSCKTIEEIQNKLTTIDTMIGLIEKMVLENNYALFITSFYGIEKEMMNNKLELQKVNFTNKVPLLLVDKSYSVSNYHLNNGTLYDLSNTIINNINPAYKTRSLIKKKSSLLSIFFKKKKKEEK